MVWYHKFVVHERKMTDGLKISLISETLEVGTRPCWDSETNLLYFVDVPTSLAYKYNPANGEVVKTKVGM